MSNELLTRVSRAGLAPQDVITEIEAIVARMPRLGKFLANLESAVGATSINWTVLFQVITTALQSGGGLPAVLAAILEHLTTIVSNPAFHAAAAAAAAPAIRDLVVKPPGGK